MPGVIFFAAPSDPNPLFGFSGDVFHFAAHFAKQLESAEASVRSSSDALRGDVLNSVTTADANATSEIPALARATSAAAKNAAEKLKELRANAAAAPSLRLEMLEHCAERRLRMERGYLAADAPKEERRAREMRRAIEGKRAVAPKG